MKKLLTVGIAAALAGGLAGGAFAQTASARDEIATAHAHALMAASADTVEVGHAHLHHVINCLVGPKGAGFDAAAGEPCKGQGNGAIPDSRGDPALEARLESALAAARSGLKASGLDTIHGDGNKAADALKADPGSAPASSSASW
jgi:hypothetical protein